MNNAAKNICWGWGSSVWTCVFLLLLGRPLGAELLGKMKSCLKADVLFEETHFSTGPSVTGRGWGLPTAETGKMH